MNCAMHKQLDPKTMPLMCCHSDLLIKRYAHTDVDAVRKALKLVRNPSDAYDKITA